MTDAEARPVTLPPHLDHEALALAQRETLNTPRRPYGLPARVLFLLLDVLYGRKRTLSKFKVLELVARVPYQSWEQVAYIAITHVALRPGLARRIHDRVAQARAHSGQGSGAPAFRVVRQDASPARMAAASATWAAATRDLSAGSSSPVSCNLTSMLPESRAEVDGTCRAWSR